MFIVKNKYYIYIDNLSSINLKNIKQGWKFCLIYRNYRDKIDVEKLKIFAKKCKKKNIKFFVSNNLFLALKIRADGVYLPSFNKNYIRINSSSLKNFQIIGSAHNLREISLKTKQGCNEIVLSRLFKTNYENKKSYYDVNKFNLLVKNFGISFVALGGIRSNNLMKLQMIRCSGIALFSEAKKKPAIIRRLF